MGEGIKIVIAAPTQVNMKQVIDTVKTYMNGKIKIDIGFNFTNISLQKKVSEMRQYLNKNALKIRIDPYFNQGAINTKMQGTSTKLGVNLYIPNSELLKIKQQIEGIKPTISVNMQGVNKVTSGSLSLGSEATLFVNTLKTQLGQSGTVIDYVYDKFGRLSVAIKTVNNETKTLTYQFDALKNKFVSLNEKIKVPDLLNQTQQIKNTIPQIKTIIDQFNLLKQQNSGQLFDFGTAKLVPGLELLNTKIRTASTGIQNITQDYKLNEKQVLSVAGQYNMLKGTFDNVTTSTGNLINRQIGLGEAFRVAMERFPIWIAASTLIMGAIHNVQEAFDTILTLSKQFTNLQMEMTQSKLVFSEITQQAYEYAKAMGSTTSSVMEAIAVFGTYTSTMEEVFEKSKAAIILANITGQTVEQSSEQIMAVLSQFKLGAKDAMSVVDQAGAVARQLQVDYPVAVKEISLGIRTVGSVAKEAGMELSQLSGIMGTLVENTRRTGTQVGNAMKTIITRLQRVSEESNPEEFRKVEKALHAVGVEMKNSANDIRPVYEVLGELANKWKDLTDVQRASVAEQVAGVYRINYFLTLMSSWEDVITNTEAALNSEGVALDKQNIYLESLYASLQKLKNAWQGLFVNTLNPEALKTTTDVLGGAITGFSKFAEVVGGIPAILTSAAVALSLFSTKAQGFFSRYLGEINTAAAMRAKYGNNFVPTLANNSIAINIPILNKLTDAVNNYRTQLNTARQQHLATFGSMPTLLQSANLSFQSLITSVKSLNLALLVAKIGTIALQGVMTLGLSVAFSIAVGWLMKLVSGFSQAKENQQDFFKQLQSDFSKLTTEVNESNKLIRSYEELSSTTNLTTESKEKLSQVMEKLESLYPQAVSNYNAENKAIGFNITLLKQLNEQKEQELQNKKGDLTKEFAFIGQEQLKTLQAYNVQIITLQKTIQAYSNGLPSILHDPSKDLKDLNDLKVKSKETFDALQSEMMATYQTDQKFKSLGDSGLLLLIRTIINESANMGITTTKGLEDVMDSIGNSDSLNIIKNYQDAVARYQKGAMDQDAIWRTQATTIEQLSTAWNGMPQSVIDALLNTFIAMPDPTKKTTDNISALNDSLIALQETFTSTRTIIKGVQDALTEYDESGSISIDTINTLAKDYPDLLQHLGNEEALRNRLTDIIQENEEAQKTAYANMIMQDESFYRTKVLGNAQLVESLNSMYGVDLTHYTSLADAKAKTDQQLIQSLGEMWAQYYNASSGLLNEEWSLAREAADYFADTPEGQALNAKLKPIENAVRKMHEMENKFKEIATNGVDFSGINLAGGDSKSGGGSDKAVEDWKSALDQINQEYLESKNLWSRKVDLGITKGLEILSDQLKIEEDRLNKLFDQRSKLTDDLLKQQEKLSESSEGSEEYNSILANIDKINIELANWSSYEEEQLQVVKKIKSEYEAINKTISNLNSITDNVISSIKNYGKDLRTQFINIVDSIQLNKIFGNNLFGKSSDFVSTLRDSLKTAMLTSVNLFNRQIPEAVAAKLTFITDAKSLQDVQKAKAILDEMYSDDKQIRLTIKDYNVMDKLLQVKKMLLEINKIEVDYDKAVKRQQSKVDNYQDQIDAINEEIDAENKAEQIAEAKLKIKEQEAEVQEKINDLKLIELDIMKVMEDKRFELITVQGERILTFDQSKVNELEEDKKSAQEAIEDANQSLIDAEQDYRDLKKDLARQEEIDDLEALKSKAEKRIIKLGENYEKEQGLWLEQHQDELKNSEIMNSEIEKLLSDSYENRLGLFRSYLEEQQNLYQTETDNIVNVTKNTSSNPVKNLYDNIKGLTQTTSTQEQTTDQTNTEVQAEQEKSQTLLELIKSSAKEHLSQIVLNQKEYLQNFTEYWTIVRTFEIAQFQDLGKIYATGYNALLNTFRSYIIEQRHLWTSLMEDAYNAGMAISKAFDSGRRYMGYEDVNWNELNYSKLNYSATFSPMSVQNSVTLVLNQQESTEVISLISGYLPTALASN